MDEAIPGLLISIVMGPVCGVGVLMVLKWMFSNELDVIAGLCAILVLFLIVVLTIMSKSHLVAGAVLTVLITLMVFLPYAIEQVSAAEMQGIDIDRLDKAYKQVSERPGNVASVFAIAEIVYDLGLPGHAVAITKKTLDQLSREMDPLTNQSLRDVFRAEESKARQWARELREGLDNRPVACPRCGHNNEPGVIACGGCKGPYLLEIARKIDPRTKIRSRIVLGWAMVATFFTVTVYSWSQTSGVWPWVSLAIGLSLVAGTFAWLFRKRSLAAR